MGWYGTGGTFSNGSVTIQFGGYAPPVETCFRCTKNAHIMYHDQNGNPWCKPCGDEQMRAQQVAAEQARRHAIAARAYEWVGAAFEACAEGNRRKLYKALSLAFHPDMGGDTQIMAIINEVKDRYRL